jgi:hypothetical protein
MGLFWVPLFLGTVQFGFRLIRAVQVNQVCRDAGHMYAFGIDFSQPSNKYLLASFGPSLSVDPTAAGGNGEVILSTINYVDDAQCLAGGYLTTLLCPNYQKDVIIRQIIVGKAFKQSAFNTPDPSIIDSSGNVQSGNLLTRGYLNDPTTIATNFSSLITLSSGVSGQQTAYVSEMFVQSSTFNLYFPGTTWVSSRNIF